VLNGRPGLQYVRQMLPDKVEFFGSNDHADPPNGTVQI
jgi:hypothetical protein